MSGFEIEKIKAAAQNDTRGQKIVQVPRQASSHYLSHLPDIYWTWVSDLESHSHRQPLANIRFGHRRHFSV